MLFGGRPLPARPLWLRVVIVAVVLIVCAPLIKASTAVLLDRFLKMSAEETARVLASHPRWGGATVGARDFRCEPGAAGWHYVCTYLEQPRISQKRVKVGVHVDRRSITQLSLPHELNARYIVP
jgi:hypothetical protein